jgi:hypothetical protein
VFTVFWAGLATLVLVPTLFLAFGLAVLVWLWAASTFVIGHWAYNALPVSVRGDMHVKMPNGKQVIFQKDRQQQSKKNGVSGFDNIDIKSETAEVKE